jgi:peptidoglycan/xylan/chitin deacetylase (PgdA/CDA1 family)
MNLFFKIKRKIFKIFYQLFHRPYGEILGLHRVVEARSLLEDNRMLEITPAFLEQTILKYKDAGYRIVSLDEVQRQIESRKREKHRFVCFTFDDGYADNYELAYPVFKKHNCPFTIYVTTDFPDQKALLWHYHLQDILLENEKLQFNGVEYDCSDLEKKNHTFRKIRELLFTSNAEMTMNALEQLFKDHAAVVRHDVSALSWKQISDLAADPLCTIGAHTVSHPALTTLSDEEIRKEMSEGKKKIEEKIKKPVKHFAYPFGNWDNRVALLAMEQYNTSVLASGGLVRKGDALDRLKRCDLDEK